MDASDWSSDASLATAEGRWARRDELDQRIAAWTSQRDDYEAMSALQAAGVPAGVVQTGQDLVERDPQLAHSGMFIDLENPHPQLGPLKADRLPLRFDRTPATVYRRSDVFGESNASVLSDWLSMETAQVAELESNGVVE